jgi:hypothetical protein
LKAGMKYTLNVAIANSNPIAPKHHKTLSAGRFHIIFTGFDQSTINPINYCQN